MALGAPVLTRGLLVSRVTCSPSKSGKEGYVITFLGSANPSAIKERVGKRRNTQDAPQMRPTKLCDFSHGWNLLHILSLAQFDKRSERSNSRVGDISAPRTKCEANRLRGSRGGAGTAHYG